MYSDSDPVTSPLMTSDLPMVAWSAVLLVATGRGAGAAADAGSGAEVVGVDTGRSGSDGRPPGVG
jgi:hypothetical protein